LLGQRDALYLAPEGEARGLELGGHHQGVGGDLDRGVEILQRCFQRVGYDG
jgi:hypothetical protein